MKHVPDTQTQSSEIWSWSLTTTGLSTFSSAWEKVRTHGSKFSLFDLVWFPNNSPKVSICLLRAIKGKLPTKSFLKELNIIPTDQCVLCNGATETMQHLYFEYSSYIWKLCKLKLGISEWFNGRSCEGGQQN